MGGQNRINNFLALAVCFSGNGHHQSSGRFMCKSLSKTPKRAYQPVSICLVAVCLTETQVQKEKMKFPSTKRRKGRLTLPLCLKKEAKVPAPGRDSWLRC
jgi:hypothetical protein